MPTIYDEDWAIPEEIRQDLVELFAQFINRHPDVTVDELVDFLKGHDKIITKYQKLDDTAIKN